MAGLYLGTNTVVNLYLGTTEVCSTYLGTNQPFDNCTYTPSTLTLLYQSSYGGDRAYLITDNPSNGTVLSGQPGTTGTFVISNPSYPSGFQGYPGASDFPTLSSTSNISATFPASGNLNVTGPTKSGGLNTIPAPSDVTASLSATATGSNYSVTVSGSPDTGQPPLSYSFTITVTPNNNYEINNPPSDGLGSTYTQSGNNWVATVSGTTSSNLILSTSVNATATLEPYNFTATVTNSISTTAGTPTVTASLTNQANVSLLAPGNAGGVTNTHTYTITGAAGGTSYVLGASAYIQGSDHQFSSGPTYTPSNSVTINSPGSYSITVTGTTQSTTNYYSVDVSPGAVVASGDPCTNLNATSTYYWADPDSNAYGNTAGSSAENIAPSGTTVYATSSGPSGSTFSGGNGDHLVSQPGTGDDFYQYISSSGVVGTDYECN